jgi:FkbM family methyltransferase
MRSLLQRVLGFVLGRTGLERMPVRVRGGLAAGAAWTLYPWTSYWRGTHEPAVQAALLGLGDLTGWACWDVGAHYGIYSIGLARRVGPGGQVAAFEPNAQSYRRLERHARMNRLPWLKTFPLAASDRTGAADLHGPPGTTFTHLAYEGEEPAATSRPMAVATARLDELLARGEIRPPDLIKIDVEGHGHRVLAGMGSALAAHRPILAVAFHSPQEVRGIRALLDPLGYDATEMGGRPGGRSDWIGGDYLFVPRPSKG